MVLALALTLAPIPAARAQRAVSSVTASITVSGTRTYVLAARTLALTATAANGRGAVLRARNVTWQVSDPTLASIDPAGVLKGISPGLVTVTATDTDANVSGAWNVFVYPGSVSVATNAPRVQIGDTITITASALDADGNAIRGVPFQYFTDQSAVANITSAGALTGMAEGRVTVTAAIDMGAAFSRFTSFSTIEVVRRASFHLQTLTSTDATTANTSTLVPLRMSAAGAYVAGVMSLSNGGQGLVLYNNGVQTLATSGSLLNGKVVIRFEGVAVNKQGDVAAIIDPQGEWCEQMLVLFTASANWAPTIIDDNTNCSYVIQPGSLDANGGLAYRFNNNVYYRKADGTVQQVLAAGSHPSGIDVVNYISNWSASPFGEVLIEAQGSSGLPVYFSWNGTSVKRLFAAGDTIGANPSQWARLPVEINAGDYITRIGGSNWASISRLRNGAWNTVAISGQNNIGWVQDGFDGTPAYIFFFADTNGGTSLFRTDGTNTTNLGTYPNWREITQVIATGGDSAVALGTLGGTVPQVVRFSATSSTPLLRNGIVVSGSPAAGLGQASIPKGINPSSNIFRTFGDALIRATPAGTTFLLRPGDHLPVGNLASIGAFATNRLGDAVMVAQHGNKTGLFTYRNGQFQLTADTDDPILGSSTIGGFAPSDTLVAMNNLGHTVAWVYSSVQALFMFTSNTASAKNILRIPGTLTPSGVAFTGVNHVAIDENDRVAFIASLSNGRSGLFLWSQGTITELAEIGQKDPAGRVLQGIYNVQAGGTKFVVRAYSTVNEVLVTDGTSLNVLATDNYITTFGTLMNYFIGPEVTMNSRGDVAFPGYTPSGAALIVKHADGTDSAVAIGAQQGPDNDWFLDLYGSGIGEQGDVIFSGLSWASGHPRIALYQASPTGN